MCPECSKEAGQSPVSFLTIISNTMKIFVNYPICKINLAPYWNLEELNITVENLHHVIENIEHKLFIDERGLFVKVFSQEDAKQIIHSANNYKKK